MDEFLSLHKWCCKFHGKWKSCVYIYVYNRCVTWLIYPTYPKNETASRVALTRTARTQNTM